MRLPAQPLAGQITPLGLNREAEGQTQAKGAGQESTYQQAAAPPDLEGRLHSLRGGGRPLPEGVRAFFEPRFGYDLSKVRVHTDTKAADVARSVKAQAFIFGNEMVFGAGQYAPETAAGRRLLAHELTHAVQQGRIRRDSQVIDRRSFSGEEQIAGEVKTRLFAPLQLPIIPIQPGLRIQCKKSSPGETRAKAPLKAYRLTLEGKTVEVSEAEYQKLIDQAKRQLRAKINLIRGYSQGGKEVHKDYLEKTRGGIGAVVGVISDILGDTVPPRLSIWDHPEIGLTAAERAIEVNKLEVAARQLKVAEDSYQWASHEFHAHIEKTIGGAQVAVKRLETTRDISFAIAIGAAVIVAAPAVAAGAGVLGTTGVTTGVVTTGTLTLGGAVAGGTLRGGATLAGEALTGKVSGKHVWKEVKEGAKAGAIDAFTAAVAPGIGRGIGKAASSIMGKQGATIAIKMSRTPLGRLALRAVKGLPTGATLGGIHGGLTAAAAGKVQEIPGAIFKGTIMGGGAGMAGGALEPLLAKLILPGRYSFQLTKMESAFHGTSPTRVAQIRTTGPKIGGDYTDDFDKAFYLARTRGTAVKIGGRNVEGSPEVLEFPHSRKDLGKVLDLVGDPKWSKLWNQYLDGPYFSGVPGAPGMSRRAAYETFGARGIAIPDARGEIFQDFLKTHVTFNPDTVIGPIPNYPGQIQIAIRNPAVLVKLMANLQFVPPEQLSMLLATLVSSAAFARE